MVTGTSESVNVERHITVSDIVIFPVSPCISGHTICLSIYMHTSNGNKLVNGGCWCDMIKLCFKDARLFEFIFLSALSYSPLVEICLRVLFAILHSCGSFQMSGWKHGLTYAIGCWQQ